MIPKNQDCEKFEPLVSAMIDDELLPGERIELDAHLEHCKSCGNLVLEFQQIDSAVGAMGLGPLASEGNDIEQRVTETIVLTRQKQSVKNWLSPWRLVPLAGVAALLVGLFLVMAQPAPEATAEQFSAEEFVEPLADLNRINLQQQRDQDLMLRTLGMDLRALKLELKQLESADPEDRQRIEKQIEMMLERVGSFERE
jgi:hypothetical protein